MADSPSGWLILILALSLLALGYLVRRRLESRRQLERQVAELEALGRIGRALVESQLDPAALYELIFQQASTIIDTSTFQLGLLENNHYSIVLWMRDGERQPPASFDINQGEGLVGWVASHKTPLLVQDYEREMDALPAQPRYLSDRPPRAAVFIPLITGDECIGVMAAQSFAPGAFSQDDVRRLSIVANQAASVMANAWLYEQAQIRAAQLELVSRVARQVRALTPLGDLIQQTVDLIQTTFGYYCVSIYSYEAEPDRISLQASTREVPVRYPGVPMPSGSGLIAWAIAHQETVLVNDVSADSRYLALSVLPDTRSEIVVPLIIEDMVLGALDVQSDQADAFGPQDRFALEALADQVALAIQESRLYEAERQQRSVAETLREVAQTLTASLELETVLNAILTDLRRVLVYDAAAILLLEADDRVVVQAAQGLESVVATQGQRFSLRDSDRLVRLSNSDRPMLFESSDPAGCYHELLALPAEHACLGAPLVARGEMIGFLTVDALPPHVYGAGDVGVIAGFAGQAAVAIDNARLFASQREEAWISSALLQVAEATSRSTDLDEVLTAVVQLTMQLVGLERCAILLWHEEEGEFVGTKMAERASELFSPDEFSRLVLTLDGWPLLSALKDHPQPVVLGGGEALSALPDELFDLFGLDAWLMLLPLVGKSGLIGIMAVSGGATEMDLVRRRVPLIGGIANQAAMAIENARLYAAQQEEAYVTIVLLQVVEAVNSLTELGDILTTIVRLIPLLVGAEQCLLLYWHADRETFSCGPDYGFDTAQLSQLQETLETPSVSSFLNALQLAREPIGAGRASPIALPAPWQGVFVGGVLVALPLVTRLGLVGALMIALPFEQTAAGKKRQNILTGIAHQAALAIENDQLRTEAAERERMERELEVAREIQSSFLPESQPEVPGWSVGAYWQAARQVGGDFYDFFRLSQKGDPPHWGIVIADVADKGVPAALYMALSRTLIRTVGLNRVEPAATLERVNDILLSDSRSDLFVTVVYAVWDPTLSQLSLANAGHNPPLCVRADGTVEAMFCGNLALGVLPQISVESQRLEMDPGDVLVLYTDGITDAMNDQGEEFGLERLQTTLLKTRPLSAPQIVQAIWEAVAGFVGETPQFDDLTVVVIKREESQPTGPQS